MGGVGSALERKEEDEEQSERGVYGAERASAERAIAELAGAELAGAISQPRDIGFGNQLPVPITHEGNCGQDTQCDINYRDKRVRGRVTYISREVTTAELGIFLPRKERARKG